MFVRLYYESPGYVVLPLVLGASLSSAEDVSLSFFLSFLLSFFLFIDVPLSLPKHLLTPFLMFRHGCVLFNNLLTVRFWYT